MKVSSGTWLHSHTVQHRAVATVRSEQLETHRSIGARCELPEAYLPTRHCDAERIVDHRRVDVRR